jgi:miniconductance mechanosensitive channel
VTDQHYLTNLRVFQAYLTGYLRDLPQINPDMVLVVRQLEATQYGLPLQIWTFAREKERIPFEQVLSSILSEIYAMLPEFGLRAFQVRADMDLQETRRLEVIDQHERDDDLDLSSLGDEALAP